MPPFLENYIDLGALLRDLSDWALENKPLAIAIAIVVPMFLFAISSKIRERRYRALLEEERISAKTQSRLPPETLERNRKEEARYRKESKAKGKEKSPTPTGRPRFK
jgi:hypothetical protein